MHYLNHEEIQVELLKLLEQFDSFARRYNLRYSLDAGTLLGAVRHKGFIPWDDDLDVIMPRPDFDRMLELARSFPQEFRLSHSETDGSSYPFAKLTNLKIEVREGNWQDPQRFLWMDIFPADGMSQNEKQNIADFEKIQKLMYRRMFQFYPSHNTLLNIIKTPIQAVMNLFQPMPKIIKRMTQIGKQYPFEASEWCRDLVWANNPDARLLSSDFDNLTELEFEGKLFPAVTHWDEYLSSQYGNYMELPPEDQRATHSLKAWYVNA